MRWERQKKQQELVHTGSQRGKNLVTSRKDQEVKGMAVTSEVHREATWEDGVAVTLQRAVSWGGSGHEYRPFFKEAGYEQRGSAVGERERAAIPGVHERCRTDPS